uniref:Structural molecule n=1 Tax=Solanum tuberosum TaxID=4113 RepID=M1D7H3_SOLTU
MRKLNHCWPSKICTYILSFISFFSSIFPNFIIYVFNHVLKVTADLTPLNAQKVAVKFDYFKIAGLIPIKAPGRARGELEITYLDEELRVSRGDLGNLFILKMVDPSYKVPT